MPINVLVMGMSFRPLPILWKGLRHLGGQSFPLTVPGHVDSRSLYQTIFTTQENTCANCDASLPSLP